MLGLGRKEGGTTSGEASSEAYVLARVEVEAHMEEGVEGSVGEDHDTLHDDVLAGEDERG